ncbi:MAG: type IV pilus biogenesis/stability protein PilW [Burkholderiales bacterium]
MSVLRRLVACAAIGAVIAGCSQNPAQPAANPATPTPPAPRETTRAEAKRFAEIDAEKKVERSRIHTELAGGYLERGNLAVALQEANEALKGNPEYAPAYGVLGLIYMQLRDEEKAEASFRRGLKVAPDDPDLNNNYGFYLCTRKREKEGIERFLIAVKNPLYKTPDRAWTNAGRCSLQRNDTAAAEDFFKTALRLNPVQLESLYNLGTINYNRGNLVEAKTYVTQLVRVMTPPNAEALWLGLRVERKLGDRNAEASYAAQLRRSYPEARETLLMQAGRYE